VYCTYGRKLRIDDEQSLELEKLDKNSLKKKMNFFQKKFSLIFFKKFLI